jgi:hypothetical protein
VGESTRKRTVEIRNKGGFRLAKTNQNRLKTDNVKGVTGSLESLDAIVVSKKSSDLLKISFFNTYFKGTMTQL